jgi:hypothetical protein
MLTQRLQGCFGAKTIPRQVRKRDVTKSPVREDCTPGSVRGAPGNVRPYLDLCPQDNILFHRQ